MAYSRFFSVVSVYMEANTVSASCICLAIAILKIAAKIRKSVRNGGGRSGRHWFSAHLSVIPDFLSLNNFNDSSKKFVPRRAENRSVQ